MSKISSAFNRWLLFCFAFIGAMIAVRIVYSGNRQFLFLVWNLFLAFVPYAISLLFEHAAFISKTMPWLIFSAWLLFYLRKMFPGKYIGSIIIAILFLASFGVYLGRFERWNSWDVVHHPLHLSSHIAADILFPFTHYRAWAVTLLLTALYSVFWFLLKAFPRRSKVYAV